VEVANTMGAASLLRRYLVTDVGSDLLGEMVKLAADVDQLCDAAYGERTEDRVNSRNGHRDRRRDSRAGTMTLEIPKLRKGSSSLSLLEPGRRGE
jgi:putative transposase